MIMELQLQPAPSLREHPFVFGPNVNITTCQYVVARHSVPSRAGYLRTRPALNPVSMDPLLSTSSPASRTGQMIVSGGHPNRSSNTCGYLEDAIAPSLTELAKLCVRKDPELPRADVSVCLATVILGCVTAVSFLLYSSIVQKSMLAAGLPKSKRRP